MSHCQGAQLTVVGALGKGTAGTCSLTGVSVAILGSTAAGEPDRSKVVYNQVINLPGVGDSGTPVSTMTWTSNLTAVVAFDLVDLVSSPVVGPSNVELDFASSYWIRIKLVVPHVGTDTARWVVQSVLATPKYVAQKEIPFMLLYMNWHATEATLVL